VILGVRQIEICNAIFVFLLYTIISWQIEILIIGKGGIEWAVNPLSGQ